jgi:hypothetical protein
MNLGKIKGYDLDKLSEERLYKYFNNPLIKQHSEYLANMNTLKKYFSDKMIFIGFFEEIWNNPMVFLERLFDFLDLNFPKEIYSEGLETKLNVGIRKEIPEKFLKYLANMYYPKIIQLHDIFNNTYTEEWLSFASQYVKKRYPQGNS